MGNKNIEQIIKKTAEETVKEALQELRNRRLIKGEMSYYRRVEILLSNYENLKEAVKQKDEEIADIEIHGLPQKSGSVVVFQSSGSKYVEGDRYTELINKYKSEKKETERDIRRIENALEKIKNDKYFNIIEMKYLKKKEEKITDEYISEKLGKDQSTITRNRKRLMNELITIFFPLSIREFA